MNPNADDVLTIDLAIAQYVVSRRQLERACRSGDLPTIKKDKRRTKNTTAGAPVKYRIRRGVLEDWLEARTPPENHVGVEVAAETCKVNQRELYDAIKAKELPAHIKERRYGRNPKIYVRLEDVAKWRDDRGVRVYRTSA